MKVNDLNVLALAYIGDAVYEIYVRKYLLEKGIVKVKELQKEAIKFVSANSQSIIIKKLIDNVLNDDEISIVYRARNHKMDRHPKNSDIVSYKYATGLEALIGSLYLDNNINRIDEIMKYVLGDD